MANEYLRKLGSVRYKKPFIVFDVFNNILPSPSALSYLTIHNDQPSRSTFSNKNFNYPAISF